MNITTAAFLLLASLATADEIILPSGARIRGDVREENDRVVVRVESGTVSFPRSQVRIVRAPSAAQRELNAKTAEAATAQDWHDAAVFAKAKNLEGVEALHRRALELDPGHEGARAALGYAKVDGRWLRGEELFAALGYVKRGAQWVTKETAGVIDDRLRLEEKLRAEQEERAEERRRAEQIRRENLAAEEAGKLERMRLGLAAAMGWEQLAIERRRIEVAREVALKTAPAVAAPAHPSAGSCGLPYPAATSERLPFQGHEPGCRAPGAANCCSRPWNYTVDRRGAGPPIQGPR